MNEKLNIQNLIELLAEKHGMSKRNADSFVKEFFQLIEEALEKDKYVKIKGLGAFKLIDVESRESVNVNTGERFEIQGHTKVSFTPEPALKDIINKPFSHFETVVLNDNTVLEDTPIDSGNEDEEDTEQSRSSCRYVRGSYCIRRNRYAGRNGDTGTGRDVDGNGVTGKSGIFGRSSGFGGSGGFG